MNRPSRAKLLVSLAAALTLLVGFSLTSCYVEGVEPPQPGYNYVDPAHGCGDLLVYKWNPSNTEAILVSAHRADLQLSTQSKTFRLDSVGTSMLDVWIDLYNAPFRLSPYCNDVVDGSASRPRRWQAISGQVTITIDRDSIPALETYKATVKLENVHFRAENGVEVELKEETFNDVLVGWFPG